MIVREGQLGSGPVQSTGAIFDTNTRLQFAHPKRTTSREFRSVPPRSAALPGGSLGSTPGSCGHLSPLSPFPAQGPGSARAGAPLRRPDAELRTASRRARRAPQPPPPLPTPPIFPAPQPRPRKLRTKRVQGAAGGQAGGLVPVAGLLRPEGRAFPPRGAHPRPRARDRGAFPALPSRPTLGRAAGAAELVSGPRRGGVGRLQVSLPGTSGGP